MSGLSRLEHSCQLLDFNVQQKMKHFFLKNKKLTRFCRGEIQLKFRIPQGKIKISRFPDSLKLQLKREKCILNSLYMNAWHFGSSIVKVHDILQHLLIFKCRTTDSCLHMEVCPNSYFWWCGYFWGPCVSFVTKDEFSVRVTKIILRIGVLWTHSLPFYF